MCAKYIPPHLRAPSLVPPSLVPPSLVPPSLVPPTKQNRTLIPHQMTSQHPPTYDNTPLLLQKLSSITGIIYVTAPFTQIVFDRYKNQSLITPKVYEYMSNNFKKFYNLKSYNLHKFIYIDYYYWNKVKTQMYGFNKSNAIVRINEIKISLLNPNLNQDIRIMDERENVEVGSLIRLHNFINNYEQFYNIEPDIMYFYINIIINKLCLLYNQSSPFFRLGNAMIDWDPVWMLNSYLWQHGYNAHDYYNKAPTVSLNIINRDTECSLMVSSYGNNTNRDIIKGKMNKSEVQLLSKNENDEPNFETTSENLYVYCITAIREIKEEIGVNLEEYKGHIVYGIHTGRMINLILRVNSDAYNQIIRDINMENSYEISKVWVCEQIYDKENIRWSQISHRVKYIKYKIKYLHLKKKLNKIKQNNTK
jgi:hypothetical protein